MATQPTNTNASAAPASGGETFQERLILMNKALLNELLKVQTGIPVTEAINTAAHIATPNEMGKMLDAENVLLTKPYEQRRTWAENGLHIMMERRLDQIRAIYPGHEILFVRHGGVAVGKDRNTVYIDNETYEILMVQNA